MTTLDIKTAQAMKARTRADDAERWTTQLRAVITYVRTNHVGMIRGDGDLTRYMGYLAQNALLAAKDANRLLESANIPEELPF